MNLAFLKGLTDGYLAAIPSSADRPDGPLGFAIQMPSEGAGQNLLGVLSKTGFTQLKLEHARIFIRKRWYVSGLSSPVQYHASDIHRWLDTMDNLARKHGGTLETWFPGA